MRLAGDLALAAWGAFARPLRTLVMALTLAAGVAAVTLSAAITAGYAAQIEQLAFGAYARAIVVTENFTVVDRFGPPRLSDLDKLRAGLSATLDTDVEAAAAWRYGRAQGAVGAERYELDVWGVLGDYRYEADMALAAGAPVEVSDRNAAARHCLLGARVHAELFDGPPDAAIGSQIRLNGVACEIVGVFDPARSQTASRFDDAVIAPFLAVARYFEPRGRLGPHEATRLTLILAERGDVTLARSEADRVLRAAHGAPLSQPAPFRFVDSAAPVRAVAEQRDLVSRLLFAVAAITMTASIIGYGGMALAAVEARRRDIAIQMASGAQGPNIAVQFLAESGLVGLLGGVSGLAAGAGLALISETIFGLASRIDPALAGGAALLGFAAGLVAGTWPAVRASAAPPAIAMRG